MPVKYSAHARKRMRERSILDSDVEGVLDNPVEVIETKYARRAAFGRLQTNDRFVVVVFEVSGEDFLVVSALKVDGVRARRYGFSRV
jgi:uncharacterized DUF497 family protein